MMTPYEIRREIDRLEALRTDMDCSSSVRPCACDEKEPSGIKVGDYVTPQDDDGDEYDRAWVPCKVVNVYKNGNLRAVGETSSWHGPIDGFKIAPFCHKASGYHATPHRGCILR